MLKSPLHRRAGSRGFTLIEVMIATAILVIGVSAMAALAAVMLTRGRQSKYMNLAGTLASEKLEDLSRWNSISPQTCVPSADTFEGSLSDSITKSITCDSGLTPANINYFDNININFANAGDCGSAGSGCFAETVSNVTGTGTNYLTTYHSPSGVIPGNADGTPISSSTPPSNVTFHRVWLIEANKPVNGTRRITVRVTLNDQSVQPPVFFQMSTVRQ